MKRSEKISTTLFWMIDKFNFFAHHTHLKKKVGGEFESI